ncbi:hypothetical protein GCM10027084_01590 [Pseudoxanthomonas sangjuensis]|uniref:ABC transporter permease n=1 Tax=Pseudoxanthomonas sangjuensis TaxID=1503750 RepID=UPI0013911FDF|nr:ABC transporter permease [Pseudoxanthomonas sangjuensis]KAF1713945.1 hypothetical protein CSC71_06115 [Pseudoxanthomonas sangjuensis]
MLEVGAGSGDRIGAFWSDLRRSLRNPEFWAMSSWMDILVRARRSRLGAIWLLMPSAIYVFGMGSIFAGMQGKSLDAFAAHVALGVMVFRGLMSTVIGSAGIYAASASFILDGRTRLTDYVLQALGKSFFDFLMCIPVACIALVLFGHVEWLGILVAPLALLVIYFNALWISVVLSLAGARFPDLGQLLSNVSVFMFLLTPILWHPEDMPADSFRGQLMRANPFYHYVELFRAPILGDPIEPATCWFMGVSTLVGLLFAAFLYRRYARWVPLWI